MSGALLICPDKRPELDPVIDGATVALCLFLGRPLIDHILDGIASTGVTSVRILACDRPADVRAHVGEGAAWGLDVEIVPEEAELSTDAALEKHPSYKADSVYDFESLPQAPGIPILESPATWHQSRGTLLPLLAAKQIGAREIQPGVWLGLRARVDDSAVLTAPCWIGPYCNVRSNAVVGPDSYLEADVIVDDHAVVENSTVARCTYLGEMTHLSKSIARGPILLNWETQSVARIADAFLLASIDPQEGMSQPVLSRILAFIVLIFTCPIILLAALKAGIQKTPLWELREAALPAESGTRRRAVAFYEFGSFRSTWRRWPRLWRVVTGHFAWTGNPPVTLSEEAIFRSDFEHLWLRTAPGIFTAPEAEGCLPPWSDDAYAHAALFSSRPTFAWRCRIIRRGLSTLFCLPQSS